MNEEQVRKIIQEELNDYKKEVEFYRYLLSSEVVFRQAIKMLDGQNIKVSGETGTKIGTDTSQKLGFYGVTPVDQPATVSDPSSAGALYSQAHSQELVDRIKDLIDRLQELGLIA